MPTKPNSNNLRAKKLGVLIKDARLFKGKTAQDCATALQMPAEMFAQFEMGITSPSLPQIEALAFYLDIPLDHFWGKEVMSEKEKLRSDLDFDKLIELRQRMIGASIRQARMEAGLSSTDLADQTGLSEETLESYELGNQPIPLPLLETIVGHLNRSVQKFLASSGPIANWATQKQARLQFSELPTEMQLFISKPVNRPYLELAQRLSEMSVEKLRSIAEGLLEITL